MAQPFAKLWLLAPLLVLATCDPEPLAPLIDNRTSEVIFSPQPPEATHNLRVAALIAGARESIDVAMYSFDNAEVEAALRDAAARGVKIRLIYEGAKHDRKLEGEARGRSRSARLEAAGIDVRYVNKIMHHKFMIADGPRDELDKAATAIIATGSANWSDAAATRYDENTLFLQGHVELALRMQAEFNLLWDHSRDFVANPELLFERSELEISEADIIDADTDHTHALFTSANFEIVGATTFTMTGRRTISDALVEAIAGASDSIRIAVGHLRDRSIAEALITKVRQDPDVDIRVYLDAQEYVSAAAYARQIKHLRECLAAAQDDESAQGECLARGYRFGYMIARAGVEVRYKWYSYSWSYPFADQMHHKYMIIDGDELWTGSYNLSNNAEHNSMENMLVFSGAEHAELIDAYAANFESLWITGRDQGLFERLLEQITTTERIPLLFEPMALEWEEVRELRALIREHCPRVHTRGFRREPRSHAVCCVLRPPEHPVRDWNQRVRSPRAAIERPWLREELELASSLRHRCP
ncbi:MAG: phospholipase D-like domain-containing protein [Enhygromyxa sp.]